MSNKMWSAGRSLGLTAVAVVAALFAAYVIGTTASILHLQGTLLARIIQYTQVQVGFLIVAVSYLVYSNTPGRYLRFYSPSLGDIGWLVPLGLIIFVFSAPDSSWFLTSALLTTPSVWIVVIVWWFLITAPAEELLFRGIIQDRLKSSFSAISAIALAAALFAGMHAAFALYQQNSASYIRHA